MQAAKSGEAIGLVELSSIARGLVVCDAMVKMAYVELIESKPFSSGKYMILIGGEVASVGASMERGVGIAGAEMVDHLFIPYAHASLFPALSGRAPKTPSGALGAIETSSVAATILAADAAVKGAEVRLLEARLGQGIGGKGYFTITGTVAAVEAAVAAGCAAIERGGHLLQSVVIPAPHDEMLSRLFP